MKYKNIFNMYLKNKIRQDNNLIKHTEKKHKIFKAVCLACSLSVSMIITFPYIYRDVPAVVLAASYTGKVTDVGEGGLRVRSTPDTSTYDNIITKVYDGDTLEITDTVNNGSLKWYKIRLYYNGEYIDGYVSADYVTVSNNSQADNGSDKNTENSSGDGENTYSDADFEEQLNTQGFPESYKEGLRQIHKIYPNWLFTAEHINRDWNDIIANESVLGRSLVYGYAKESWKSKAEGAYNSETGEYTVFDSGGWVQASDALIEYAIDPRNFLNETNIFMFEDLAFSGQIQTEQGVQNVIAGSFMGNSSHELYFDGMTFTYPSALYYAGSVTGVSPYHLATRIIQEQGYNGQGLSISGTYPGYEGLFNYYNQGAYKSGDISAVENGLIYASKNDPSTYRAWDSRMKSIVGGAKILGANYINRGQNTLYYEKFDMITPYTHQYMTFILAPRQESVTASKAYSESTKKSTALRFMIPVYNDMPDSACPLPEDNNDSNSNSNGNSTNNDSSETVTPKFTGIKLDEDGVWRYYRDDVADYSYNGVAASNTGWWKVTGGVVDFNYTGLAQNEYGWWYITDGSVNFGYNGLVQNEAGWWYIINGYVDFNYTGFADNEAGTWYVEGGQVRFDVSGLAGIADDWRYVMQGLVDTGVNSVVGNEAGWWKVTNGRVDFGYTGLAKNAYGWWYITDGYVNFNYIGFADNEAGTWYVEGGQVRFDASGLAGSEKDWKYVNNGLADTGVSGLVQNIYGWWYVNNGSVVFDYTGLVQNDYGWWYVNDGKVVFDYTGLARNEYGWWCIREGQVDFTYTGDFKDENGTWHVVNGYVV